ncbi:hypothetical protein HDU96_008081 [Phlyctochytrium bullatum]|nr:hypothetical protein HDU96_008081 [Phlyctochytrium bullatum]
MTRHNSLNVPGTPTSSQQQQNAQRRQMSDGTPVYKATSDSGSQSSLVLARSSQLGLDRNKEKSDSQFQLKPRQSPNASGSWTDMRSLEESLSKLARSMDEGLPRAGSGEFSRPSRTGIDEGKIMPKLALGIRDSTSMQVDEPARSKMQHQSAPLQMQNQPSIQLGERPLHEARSSQNEAIVAGVGSIAAREVAGLLQREVTPGFKNLLLIDMRSKEDYTRSYIHSSVNMNLPAMILKRCRKGSVSTLNMSHFLTTQQSKLRYLEWKARAQRGEQSQIVVYDYDTTDEDADSDVFVFSKVLLYGVFTSHDENVQILKDRTHEAVEVAFLNGGFSSFAFDEDLSPWLRSESDSMDDAPRSDDGVTLPPSRLILAGSNSAAPVANDVPRIMPIQPTSRVTTQELKISPKESKSLQGSPASANSLDVSPTARGAGLRKKSGLSIHTPVSATRAEQRFSTIAGSPNMHLSPEQSDTLPTSLPQQQAFGPAAMDVFSPEIMDPYSRLNDYLFLGSDAIPTADDAVQQLQNLGVTHVLNMAAEINSKALLAPNCPIFHKWLRLQDSADQDVEEAIKEGTRFIDEARSRNPSAKILVHCRAGKSRSVTMVMAYLILRERMVLKDAYEFVRQKRSGVAPNIGFMLSLMRLEKEVHGVNTSISV